MATYPLELSAAEMRGLVDQATDRIVTFIESLPDQPSVDVDGAMELARSMIEADPPELGQKAGELFDLLFDRLIPSSFNTAGPGYLAYIPGGGLFHAAVADLIADATNRYVGVCAPAPALVQLESNVIRWFCRFVGYPAGAGGLLTTGGSLANFTAIVTARKERLGDDLQNAAIYTSDQVHHSVQKAANLAGFPYASVREIASDERFRIRIDSLRQTIARDREAGQRPFLIVGSAGTTNTGAVDDLEALADLARSENCWLHIDGAYGAFFVLTERGRRLMKGIERADSITLDPHKSLFLPYGTGSLLVRDAGALRRAHSLHADYLPAMQAEADLVDFCEIGPELSRDFRGLRVWLPLKMHGVDVFRRQLDEKLDLAEWAAAELRRIDGIEIVAEPELSVVAFRLVRPGLSLEELNALNRTFLEKINARKRVMLTPTVLADRFILRICVLSFRTHMDRMKMALDDIRAAVASS